MGCFKELIIVTIVWNQYLIGNERFNREKLFIDLQTQIEIIQIQQFFFDENKLS